jgi:hypothetical protein
MDPTGAQPTSKRFVDFGVIPAAWTDLPKNPIWLGGSAIMLLSGVVFWTLDDLANLEGLSAKNELLSGIGPGIVGSCIETVLVGTYMREYLRFLRGESPRIGQMLSPGPRLWSLIAVGIFLELVLTPFWLVLQQHSNEEFAWLWFIGTGLGAMLTTMPFVFAPLIAADTESGPITALVKSARLFFRAPWPMLWLFVITSIYMFAGLLLCVVGLILTFPIQPFAFTRVYKGILEP